jgi:hypothetical protein
MQNTTKDDQTKTHGGEKPQQVKKVRKPTVTQLEMKTAIQQVNQRIIDISNERAGRAGEKVAKKSAARNKAFASSIDSCLMDMSEKARFDFFVAIEVAATKACRDLISGHPLRPEGVTAIVETRIAAEEGDDAIVSRTPRQETPANAVD